MQTMPHPQLAPILLLTRPEAAAQRFLTQLGIQVQTLIAPLMQIELLDVAPVRADLRAIILTSENGAMAAGRIDGLPRRAYCVGDRTAEAARALGFAPISANGDARALIALILSHRETGPLLYLRGEHISGDVARWLNTAGVVTGQAVAYRQTSLPLAKAALTALNGLAPVVLPLFSPRTVTILIAQGPFTAPLYVVPISATVAQMALALHPKVVEQADSPDALAMVRAVNRCLGRVEGD